MAKASIEVVHIVVREGDWRRLVNSLARIERALGIIHNEQEHDMSEIDDKLAAEGTALAALEADEQRELTDLQALKDAGQTLTPDQEATFDAYTARIAAADAAINAADPAPVVTDPGTGDAPVDGGDAPVDGDTPAV